MVVLNELSYSGILVRKEEQAKLLYDLLFKTCLNIESDLRIKLHFSYSKSLQEEVFHHNFPFLKWLGAQTRENKTSILSMLTNQPFIHDYPFYKVFGSEGKGIGYAYENEELLISFQSHENWKTSILSIVQESINEETEQIETATLCIKNCYDETSKDRHLNFLKDKLQYDDISTLNEIVNSRLLWERRDTLFPSLPFCDSTEEYIKSISGSVLQNLLKRLNEYEKYFTNWKDGDFDPSKLGGRPRLESDTRIKNFGKQLMINCPDGEERLFSFHCNYGMHGFRMHFFPDVKSRKCIIGYIGKKIT
jgi:hypothetical protein